MLKGKFTLFTILTVCILSLNTIALSKETSSQWKDLDEVVAEIEKVNAAFKTLKADILYTRTITLLESKEISKGELNYKKPNKMYLRFYPPRNEINVIDGKHLWVYHPEQKQVEKYEMKHSSQSSQGLNFFEFGYGESVSEVKKNYKITLLDTEEEGKKRFYLLGLTPKDPKSQYSDIRLWIEEGFWLPGKVDLYESQGEIVNTIEFKNVKLDKRISDKLFIFDVPRGVEVIEPLK